MITFPADEQRISEVERGRSCEAVVRRHPGETLAAGDNVLFALSHSRVGEEPNFVKGGDSVLVTLTNVADLHQTDPATGHALVHLRWDPLGRREPTVAPKRAPKVPRSQGSA